MRSTFLFIAVHIFILCVLFGCKKVSDKPLVSPERLEELAKEYIYNKHPNLSAEAQFSVQEYLIKDIETLPIRVVLVKTSQVGVGSNEELLVYHDGKFFQLAPIFGGGLMSAVVFKGHLYYTYSFGSGQHLSCLARLSVVGGKLIFADALGTDGKDWFLKIKDSKLILEMGVVGEYYVFELNPYSNISSKKRLTLWNTEHYVGEIKPNKNGFTVIDKDGKIVKNFTGKAYRKEPQE